MPLLGRSHADGVEAPVPHGAAPRSRPPAARRAPRGLTLRPPRSLPRTAGAIAVCCLLTACGGHDARPGAAAANRPATVSAHPSPVLSRAAAAKRKPVTSRHSGTAKRRTASSAKAGSTHATTTSRPASRSSKPLLGVRSKASTRPTGTPTGTGLLTPKATPKTTSSVPDPHRSGGNHVVGDGRSGPLLP
jgi:hypothetical protein